MCSLQPTPFSYLCVQVRILGVLKIVCCWTIKPNCHLCLLWSRFLTDSSACILSFYHTTPLHYDYVLAFVKLLTISILITMYIMCVVLFLIIMFVQCFELWDRHFTNFHDYYLKCKLASMYSCTQFHVNSFLFNPV